MPDTIAVQESLTRSIPNPVSAPEIIPEISAAIVMEEYHDFEALLPAAREWDDFVEKRGGEIFMSFDWCRLWWRYYGTDRKLLVLVFRQAQRIVGIIPVFLESVRLTVFQLRIVKLVGSDFGPFTFSLCIEPEAMAPVVAQLVRRLKAERWDLLFLGDLAGRYEAADALHTHMQEQFGEAFTVLNRVCNVQTYHDIPDSWEKLLQQLPRGDRYKFKREYDRLNRERKTLHSTLATENTFEQYFDAFVNSHQLYWKGKKRSGHFNAWPCSREFHREVARRQLELGRLRLHRLAIDNDVIGYSYNYKFGSTYLLFLDGRKTETDTSRISFFRLDHGELSRKAMLENVRSFDSLRGNYEYKLRVGGFHKDIRQISVHPAGAFEKYRMKSIIGLIRIYDILYQKIWRSKIMPRIGLAARPLSRTWVKLHVLKYCYWR